MESCDLPPIIPLPTDHPWNPDTMRTDHRNEHDSNESLHYWAQLGTLQRGGWAVGSTFTHRPACRVPRQPLSPWARLVRWVRTLG
jgi:hypothetical protein